MMRPNETAPSAKHRRRLRRPLAVLVVALVVAGASCGTDTASQPPTPGKTRLTKPNVVFVLTDDMDLALLDVMPHTKRLVGEQGMTFEKHFDNNSLCCPARVSLLRGQYAHNTGVLSNAGAFGGYGAAKRTGIENDTMATALQKHGYRTALIGKYLNGYPEAGSEMVVPPGWDEWSVGTKEVPAYNQYDYSLNHNGKVETYGKGSEDYGTHVYMRQTREFIDKSVAESKPFFAYLNVYPPHEPATPAPEDKGLFADAKVPRNESYNEADVSDKPNFVAKMPPLTVEAQTKADNLYRKRMQSMQAVDRGIRDLVGHLDKAGLLAKTYFVFSSDNGYHLGQHRMPSGKRMPYEEDVHLPLLISGPTIDPGTRTDRLTGNIDLAPTILDLAGTTLGYDPDGRSLVPLLHGETPATWRNSYFLELYNDAPMSALTSTTARISEPPDEDQQPRAAVGGDSRGLLPAQAGGAPAVDFRIPGYSGIRTATRSYVEYGGDKPELYDLSADPLQLRNQAATADKALVATLKQRVAELLACKGVVCRQIEDKPVP